MRYPHSSSCIWSHYRGKSSISCMQRNDRSNMQVSKQTNYFLSINPIVEEHWYLYEILSHFQTGIHPFRILAMQSKVTLEITRRISWHKSINMYLWPPSSHWDKFWEGMTFKKLWKFLTLKYIISTSNYCSTCLN